eukprot:m.488741 g.488741  ORF g.488741 m.488741 type:complete len:147 (-) comp26041_c0_seq1:70-510(-)
MAVFSLYIVNKAGSLLFHCDYGAARRLPANERITLASTFHGLSAIAAQISPTPDSIGISVLEASTFRLQSFQTLTGIQFIIVADPGQPGLEQLLRKVYEIYTDYVLKNPFYSLDMPIRCELFDQHLSSLIEQNERLSPYRPAGTSY